MSYIPGDYVIVNGQLYHHGTKGMRWGVRRYQNKDGSLTPEGRKRYSDEADRLEKKAGSTSKSAIGRLASKSYAGKAEKYRKKIADSDAKEAKKNEDDESKKKRIREKPDAKSVYENRHLFSDKEIQDLYNRLNNEQNIKKLIPEEKSAVKEFIDGYASTSKTIKQVVDSSDDLYKSYEKGMKLIDALSKSGKKAGG